jgi:hypothetical protein
MKDHENFVGFKAPPNFKEMVEIARRLSAGMDYLRVDMYTVNGRIVVGELSIYAGNGRSVYLPQKWDFRFGSYW